MLKPCSCAPASAARAARKTLHEFELRAIWRIVRSRGGQARQERLDAAQLSCDSASWAAASCDPQNLAHDPQYDYATRQGALRYRILPIRVDQSANAPLRHAQHGSLFPRFDGQGTRVSAVNAAAALGQAGLACPRAPAKREHAKPHSARHRSAVSLRQRGWPRFLAVPRPHFRSEPW
jgi:hypothetical protein